MLVLPVKVHIAHRKVAAAILVALVMAAPAQAMLSPQCKVSRYAMPDANALVAINKQRAQWLAQASDEPRVFDGKDLSRTKPSSDARYALDSPGASTSSFGIAFGGIRTGASMRKSVRYEDGGKTYTVVVTPNVSDSEAIEADKHRRRASDALGPERNPLLNAIERADVRAVRALIAEGIDLRNVKDREGRKVALLSRALAHWDGRANQNKSSPRQNGEFASYRAVILALVDAGADINEIAYSSPLLQLVSGNLNFPEPADTLAMMRYFLEHGATTSLQVFERAVWRGDPHMLDVLLRHGHPTEEQLNGAMAYAASNSRFDAVVRLLDAGAAPKFRIDDRTPREVIKSLVRHKVDLKTESAMGNHPLATVIHDHELMQDFLDLGANPDLSVQAANGVGDTALHLALRDRPGMAPTPGRHAYAPEIRRRSVELLLQHGARPDVRNGQGYTPLMLTSNDDGPAIELLLRAGGTVNPKAGRAGEGSQHGEATGPVTWALLEGNETLATALVKRSRRLAAEDCGALYYAASGGASTTVQAILDLKGAPLSVIESRGDTPLVAAARAGHVHTVKILLASRAVDVNEATSVPFELCLICHIHSSPPTGNITPLMAAVGSRRLDLVKLMLDHGADVHRKDSTGRTAGEYASYESVDHYRAMQALLRDAESARKEEKLVPTERQFSKLARAALGSILAGSAHDLPLLLAPAFQPMLYGEENTSEMLECEKLATLSLYHTGANAEKFIVAECANSATRAIRLADLSVARVSEPRNDPTPGRPFARRILEDGSDFWYFPVATLGGTHVQSTALVYAPVSRKAYIVQAATRPLCDMEANIAMPLCRDTEKALHAVLMQMVRQ